MLSHLTKTLVLLALSHSAWAQIEVDPQSAKPVTSPLRISILPRDGEDAERSALRYRLAPGASEQDRLVIKNRTAESKSFLVYTAEGYTTPDGALAGPVAGQPKQGTGLWTSVEPTEANIGPDQSVYFTVQARPQENATPGDHLALLFIQPRTRESETTSTATSTNTSVAIRIESRTGIPVLFRVPGPLTPALEIVTVERKLRGNSVFLELNLKNTGNVYLKPLLDAQLTGSDGSSLLSERQRSLGYVFPGYSLKLSLPISPGKPLRRDQYKLHLKLSYRDEEMRPLADYLLTEQEKTVTLP